MTDPNVAIAKQLYSDFLSGNLEGIANVLHDRVAWQFPGVPEVLPLTGRYDGPQAVLSWFGILAREMDVLAFEAQHFLSDHKGKVVVLGQETVCIHRTKREFFTRWAHVLEFEDSKVIGFYEHTDTATQVAAYSD